MKSIKAKLLTALLLLFTVLPAIGGAGWYAAKIANDGLSTVYSDRVRPLGDLKAVADMYAVNIVDTSHKVRNGNLQWSDGQKAVEEASAKIKKHWQAYAETHMDADERQLAKSAAELMKKADDAVDQLNKIIGSKDKNRLDSFVVSQLYSVIDPVSDAISKLIDLQVRVAGTEFKSSAESFAHARIAMIATFIVGILVLVFTMWTALMQVLKPFSALTDGMRHLANGDFNVVLPGLARKDEVGAMARAVEDFKVKAAEKAAREAQEKTDQDRRAAAERAAAEQKMAAEFEAAVGGLVKAAVAGDFRQRVDLEGKTGLVLNVGTALNTLCDNVARALDDLARMIGALAEGDLTQRIRANYQGMFGKLKADANAMAEKLTSIVSQIKSGAGEVAGASAEISTGTTDLSQRTEEQAASLEETSASMEQISATVKKNAQNAQQANQSAGSTREVASRGGEVVTQAVAAMSRIEDSSRKISDIISVIDEIARQTNLLALNAAVEAARAGDAGRGFAVVAAEVRTLAQRSSQAAKDIKDLIDNSTTQVADGVDLVNRTGGQLKEILTSIDSMAAIVAEIASASAEQAGGVDQINKALSQMDEVTQQNSALVEQNAASAKTLEQQAQAMQNQVEFFRLDSSSSSGAGRYSSGSIAAAA
jgi:methyl-accepting chemotaxis protein